jgi:glycosyltransferase involved in cell wall biosynthesis
MPYHIALSRSFDFAAINQARQAGTCPNHSIWELAQKLNATIHQPQYKVTAFDRMAARCYGQPEHWALARHLVATLGEEDLLFCTGEDIGLPVAILSKLHWSKFKLVMSVMAPDRLKFRAVSRLFDLGTVVDLFITNTQIKVDTLRHHLGLLPHQIHQNTEQTDVNFFNPGPSQPPSPAKARPMIASAGLEQRDYKTLAAATAHLDVDVKICAVSPNASTKTTVAFPEVMPANMTSRHYDWPEFVQLYRDADVVVISLLDNQYSAGLTTLIEAMACRKPVVMTRTPGLAEQLIELGVFTPVEPGDAVGMGEAIAHLLQNPEVAAAQAQRGYELVQQKYRSEHYVDNFAMEFQRLSRKGIAENPLSAPLSSLLESAGQEQQA